MSKKALTGEQIFTKSSQERREKNTTTQWCFFFRPHSLLLPAGK
ncbi:MULTISPECIES: hypothetical protein [Sporomusa]